MVGPVHGLWLRRLDAVAERAAGLSLKRLKSSSREMTVPAGGKVRL